MCFKTYLNHPIGQLGWSLPLVPRNVACWQQPAVVRNLSAACLMRGMARISKSCNHVITRVRQISENLHKRLHKEHKIRKKWPKISSWFDKFFQVLQICMVFLAHVSAQSFDQKTLSAQKDSLLESLGLAGWGDAGRVSNFTGHQSRSWMADPLTGGWMAGWLTGCLAGWFDSWLDGRLGHWLVDWLACWMDG